MALTILYFSYSDPVTGKLTKGYGYEVTKKLQNLVMKVIKGSAKLLKHEEVSKEDRIVPRVDNLQELTKEQFDALDVSGESLTSALARETGFLMLKKLSKKYDKEYVAPDLSVVAKKLEAAK